MPDLEEITYSRAATIAAISSYYDFLTKMYLNESKVIHPPSGGWPSIVNADPDALRTLGKSDEVLQLLAHLPYIRSPRNWHNDAEAAPECILAEWQDLIAYLSPGSVTGGEDMRIASEGATFASLAPSHVFGLGFGGRDNAVMVLDTKLGIIHWEDCPARIEWGNWKEQALYEPDDDVPEEEAHWRYSAAAWAIPDFFEVLKDQFRTLNWIPISPYTVRSAASCGGPQEEGMASTLQDIYHEHGWPDLATYRKAECLEAVKKVLLERYPDSVCIRR
ncbi:hypothetical protein CCHL11_06201 [Colletotrichum chlorophyti]|uniref:Uncharacterized protein n=1 Tax=Colletotrichum chlorophyti TaxID=708187 RepID=A0A1Q8RTP6_9PEZI|nr:hypothetical protein CCHL11_06201 [Colletotrichum chlorophyti]